jgi:hypothetical protein
MSEEGGTDMDVVLPADCLSIQEIGAAGSQMFGNVPSYFVENQILVLLRVRVRDCMARTN